MAARSYIEANTCPICGCVGKGKRYHDPVDWEGNCPNCGNFYLHVDAESMLHEGKFSQLDLKLPKARLSHEIWKAQTPSGAFRVTRQFAEVALKKPLPAPAERLDRLIAYIGRQREEQPDRPFNETTAFLCAKIGVMGAAGVHYIANAGHERKWLIYSNYPHENFAESYFEITLDGWQRYDQIVKGLVWSNRAFMAMKFEAKNTTSEKFFRGYLIPGMEQLGITLERVDTNHKAGMIDDKIRLDIRNCKFVLADLTHDNLGVTWETGFAEGKGKHVYFLCNRKIKHAGKVHFDLSHQNIIFWTPGKELEAVERLKASIRYEFPDVRQSDPDPA